MAKPTTTQRGYGSTHQTERKRWEPIVATGTTICTRCDQPINPTEPWDLDHNETRTGYLGAAHRNCNRAAGARNGHAQRTMTTREW